MNALLSRCASLRWLPRNLKPGQMIALCALAAAGLGMLLIATKLLPRPASMEQTGDVLLACCLLAAAGTFLYSCAANSLRWAAGFFVIAVSLGLLAEIAGMRLPVFGSKYRYHPVLESSAVAGIPLFVPLAWYFLSHQALMTMRPILNRCGRGSHTGTVASALVLCGYDLMLDPIATELALWTWLEPGAFFGVPVLNSLGWFAVGLGIFSLARHLKAPREAPWSPFHLALDVIAALITALAIVVLAGLALNVMTDRAFAITLTVVALPLWGMWMRAILAREPGKADIAT